MALAPGTTARIAAKNSGRYLAEGEGLRSDRATLAKTAVSPAMLKSHVNVSPLARKRSLIDTAPVPVIPFTPAPTTGGIGGVLHHAREFVSGRENLYGRPVDPNAGQFHDAQGAVLHPQGGVIVSAGLALPVLKLAAAGLIGKQVGKAVPGVPGRVLRQASQSAVGAPAGLYDLATKPAETVKGIGQRYAYDYGPLAHGDVGEFLHRASMDPLGVGLDAFTAASLLTQAAAKSGVIEKPAATRTLGVPGTEGTVQPFRSPNTLTAIAQHRFDRFSERHPNAPVVGAVPRAAKRIGFEAERDFERAGAAAIPFMLAERQLRDPRLKVAYDVLHRYGHEEPNVAADRLRSEIQMRETRLATDHSERIHELQQVIDSGRATKEARSELATLKADQPSLIERANQKKTLIALKAAQPFVDRFAAEHGAEQASRATTKLRAALAEGVPLANLGEQTRIESGQVHPESAAQRREQPSRLVTGGTFVESRLSQSLLRERENVARLERQHEAAVAKRDKASEELLRREQIGSKNARAFNERRAALANGETAPKGSRPYELNEPGGVAARSATANSAGLVGMVKKGEKPSALLPLADKQGARGMASLAQGYGLHAHVERVGDKFRVYVARDPEALDALTRADRLPDSPERDTLLGKALGYSEKDVANFVERKHGAPAVGDGSLPPRQPGVSNADRLNELKRAGVPEGLAQVLMHSERAVDNAERRLADASLPGERAEQQRILEGQRRLLANHVKQARAALSGGDSGPVALTRGMILSGRKVLSPRHQAQVDRLSGALSVAQERVQKLEAQHVDRYGFLPEQRHQIELVGGEAPGKGAAYVSDTAPMRTRSAVARMRQITGKAPKQGYQHQSRGTLFTEGRARRSSKQVLRDFVSTARSLSRQRDVEEATRFSKPLNPDSPNLLDPGHVFFNPEGHKIPRRFQEGPPVEELEQMLPNELARSARNEYDAYLRSVFVTPEQAAGLMDGKSAFAQAVKDGKIRQIDHRIADAFEAGRSMIPGGRSGLAGHLLDLLDLSNNVTRMAVLYGKGSFVPMNFGGNVGFLAVQQGPWLGVNLAKAARLMGDFTPDNLRWVDLEVGSGAALSISHEAVGPLGGATRAIGHASNVGADLLPRRAAWIHEAAQHGIKTNADVTRLREQVQAGSARAKALANQISESAEKAMVQFRGLGPTERAVLTRVIFIYPWLKGATRYLGRLPLDRPLQADLSAHLGQQGYDDTVKTLGKLVSFLQGIVPTGKVEHRLGTDIVPVRNPAALTPFGTGAQAIQLFQGLVAGHSVPAAFRVGSLLQPTLGALVSASTGTNLSTGHQYPGDKGFMEIVYSNLADSFAIQQTLKIAGQKRQTEPFTGSPSSQKLYVQEGGFKDALKQFFEGGFRKRDLNLTAEQAKSRAEQRESMTPLERAKDDVTHFHSELVKAAEKTKLPIVKDGELIPGVTLAVDALAARKLNRIAWADRNKAHGPLTVEQRVAADAELLASQHKISAQAAKRLTVWAQKTAKTPVGKDQVQKILDTLGAVYFHRGVLTLVERALKLKGVDVRVPS